MNIKVNIYEKYVKEKRLTDLYGNFIDAIDGATHLVIYGHRFNNINKIYPLILNTETTNIISLLIEDAINEECR